MKTKTDKQIIKQLKSQISDLKIENSNLYNDLESKEITISELKDFLIESIHKFENTCDYQKLTNLIKGGIKMKTQTLENYIYPHNSKNLFYDLDNINLNSEIEFETFLKRNNRIDLNNTSELKDFIFYCLEQYQEIKDDVFKTGIGIDNLELKAENKELKKELKMIKENNSKLIKKYLYDENGKIKISEKE